MAPNILYPILASLATGGPLMPISGMEKDRYHYKYIGVNSRLDSVQAAILNIKLKHLESYNDSRIDVANYYDKCFSDSEQITTPKRADFSTHIFHQYTIIIKNKNRDKLSAHLQNKGIPFGVYYPVPLHLQTPYSDVRFKKEDLKSLDLLRSKRDKIFIENNKFSIQKKINTKL